MAVVEKEFLINGDEVTLDPIEQPPPYSSKFRDLSADHHDDEDIENQMPMEARPPRSVIVGASNS